MKDENFEKLDQTLMNQFKAMREKKIPSHIVEGFSVSVQRQILDKQGKKTPQFGFLKWGVPVLVPAFAVVLFLASTALLRYPAGVKTHPQTAAPRSSAVSISTPSNPEISEEVNFLSELGEWNEEDEAEFN